MVCVKLLIYWILLGLVKTEYVFRETKPCGKNITSAGGELVMPYMSLRPCNWWFVRPEGEKISMSFKGNQSCCFEILVYDGIVDTGPVLFNISTDRWNSSNVQNVPSIMYINTSKALVSFRLLYITQGPLVELRYYSETSPDNKGNRFIIPDVDSLIVSTYNSQKVPVHLYCPSRLQDFNVSIDSTYNLTNSGTTDVGLQAKGDLVVYTQTQNSTPSAVMPLDVLGTKYIIVSSNLNPRITVTGIGKTTTVNLTFPECIGNCSLPSCARQKITYKLNQHMACERLSHSCQADLTGSIITSDLPVLVMVAGAHQILQMPPVNTWGRKFISTTFPGIFSMFTLKIVSKEADTNVAIFLYKLNATLYTFEHYLNNSGEHVIQLFTTFTTDSYYLIKSNKPVLPVQIMTDPVENMFIIPPVEQYASDYLLPAELCNSQNKSLVIIIETKYVNGLRMNGLPIAMNNLERKKIGETGYSSLFFNLNVPKLHFLRHTEQNIVFGVFLICSSNNAKHIIPLGMRMAPIAQKCTPTLSIPGDGLDNDCDELIDEDICDTNSADVNSKSDCAGTSGEILPCLRYTDTNGVVWKTTIPNNYDYQTCGIGSTGQTSNFCELKEGRYGVWKGPSLCVSEQLSDIAVELHLNLNGTSNVTLADILDKTFTVTNKLISKDDFNAGNLNSVINILDLVVTIIEERSSQGTTKRERENFMSVLDRLLSTVNGKSWRALTLRIKTTNHVSNIMNVVTRFGFQVNINQSEDVTLVRENILLEAKEAFIDDVIFPNATALSANYQLMTNARLFLSKDTIKNNLNGSIDYTAVYYRTLTKLLP